MPAVTWNIRIPARSRDLPTVRFNWFLVLPKRQPPLHTFFDSREHFLILHIRQSLLETNFGVMAVDGYGTFAVLPREIRDQIYEDLFKVTNVKDIAEHARRSKVVFSAYVAQPYPSILMASRALYEEVLPVVLHQNFSCTGLMIRSFGTKLAN